MSVASPFPPPAHLPPATSPPDTNEASRVLAAMGHDLRTPLNAILGFTGTLLMQLPGPLNADQEKHLKTVQSSGRQLLDLINALVDLAKLESGALQPQPESIACASLAEEALVAVRPRAELRGLSLELVDRLEPGRRLHGDPRVLARILSCLAGNAVKFTERGSVRLVLQASADPSGRNTIEFQVHDTGPGIPDDARDRLFAPPVHPGGRRPGQGPGLGLYLSHRLAQLTGSSLGVDSQPGKGSVFTLAVPEPPA